MRIQCHAKFLYANFCIQISNPMFSPRTACAVTMFSVFNCNAISSFMLPREHQLIRQAFRYSPENLLLPTCVSNTLRTLGKVVVGP